MSLEEICDLPVNDVATKNAHLYLWVPNSMLLDGLKVMEAWGFRYVNLRNWLKLGSDGNPIRNGLGWYTRGCTEPILFGIKGKLPCNAEGKSLNNIFEGDVNTFGEPRREHSRKPDSFYEYVQKCSPGPYLDLFGRQSRENWAVWGNEATKFNED
jgi:N6-adenosine-specific RNA methylase IME4